MSLSSQHEIFRGKPSFVDNKNGKKKERRFGELSTDEIQDIVDNAGPVTTKKATKFAMKLFNDANISVKFPSEVAKFQI